MHIICKDGTTIQCQDFEAIGTGVLFYQDTSSQRSDASGEADDEAETDAEAEDEAGHFEAGGRASGFVPMPEIQYVLPDEMLQQMPQQRQPMQQYQGGYPQGGVPGQGGPGQQMGQPPGNPGGR